MSTVKISVLHVVNIFFTIPYFLGEQLSYFANKGYTMHVICSPSDEVVTYAEKHRFKYKEVNILRKISLFADLKAVYLVYKYIKQQKIEIVNGHTPKGALIAMVAAAFAGVSIRIYFRHGLVYETSRGFKRFLLIYMDKLTAFLATKIVCVSTSVAIQSLKDKLNSPNKQLVLASGTCNGIDTERFCKTKFSIENLEGLKSKIGISTDNFIIGYVGRLVRDKGIIELVRAFIRVNNKYPNVYLLLIGMLEERDALPEDVVRKIRQHKNIIMTGYVGYDCIEKYYAMMDLFVLPSYREGFPTSILEASAMEIPVITTRATGCCEAILENITGKFVSHDSELLADTIEYFIEHPEQRTEMGLNGRKFVCANFGQNIVWNDIEKLYQS